LDCVIYCAFYSIFFGGGVFFPDTVYSEFLFPIRISTTLQNVTLVTNRCVFTVMNECILTISFTRRWSKRALENVGYTPQLSYTAHVWVAISAGRLKTRELEKSGTDCEAGWKTRKNVKVL